MALPVAHSNAFDPALAMSKAIAKERSYSFGQEVAFSYISALDGNVGELVSSSVSTSWMTNGLYIVAKGYDIDLAEMVLTGEPDDHVKLAKLLPEIDEWMQAYLDGGDDMISEYKAGLESSAKRLWAATYRVPEGKADQLWKICASHQRTRFADAARSGVEFIFTTRKDDFSKRVRR